MTSQETWDWVLAADVMAPVRDKVASETSLSDALDHMRVNGIEELPVTAGDEAEHAVGILDQRQVKIRVNEEVVRRRQSSETVAGP